MPKKSKKVLFSGGGTGGHLFPAIAIAQKLSELRPDYELLFVGTSDKIESRVVPQEEFNYESIPVAGFYRNRKYRNILFPFKLIASVLKSFSICLRFKPDVAVGAGAYVSGPIVWMAAQFNADILLLEQNSFPGVTNRMLQKSAKEIHVTFEESKKYFKNSDKIKVTGNPIRITLKTIESSKAKSGYGLNARKKTILITGGSLGAAALNKAVAETIEELVKNDLQVIWQTGKLYYERYKHLAGDAVKVMPFIDDISSAYSAADLVVARAGATTISELSFLGKAVLFVPSPNVAANHQYKNAKAMVDKDSADMITDDELNTLGSKVLSIVNDENLLNRYSENIKSFAKPDAVTKIAERIIHYCEDKN